MGIRGGQKEILLSNLVGADVYYCANIDGIEFAVLDGGKKKVKKSLVSEFITFDIETTTLNKYLNIMYIWTICIDGSLIYGRTWQEFVYMLTIIQEAVPDESKLICYVHNLSYEFQYLRGIIEFDSVFCVDRRKVLKASYGNMEFRCSYYLSNMSLAAWGKQLQVEHLKLDGEIFDYRKIRYPWNKLDDYEMDYSLTDTLTLYECVLKQMELEGDTLYTIPLTSTGYVRRDTKSVLYRRMKELREIFPDVNQIMLLRKMFRGGNTHANRYYAMQMLDDIYSNDFQSSYPFVAMVEQYPMSKFEEKPATIYSLKKELDAKRAIMMELVLEDVTLKKDWWGFPYIPVDKVRNLQKVVKDNGRVIQAQHLEIACTDVDYKIVESEYNFRIVAVKQLYSARYGYLPKEVKAVIMRYFTKKTGLKGVKGEEVYYIKSKNKVNAIYGMMVQNPIKPDVEYINFEFEEKELDIPAKMYDYHKHGFLPYQWGVWITAWARYNLECALEIAGDQAVYCDTDSVKTVGRVDYSSLNNRLVDKAKRFGAYAVDKNGKTQYMGAFEDDGHYTRFITFGAKKYCYEDEKGLHITIAGVGKIKGAEELAESGGIEQLKLGYVFRTAGGLESVFNDEPTYNLKIGDKTVTVTPNIAMGPSTYTLSVTDDYQDLINTCLNGIMFSKMLDNV